MQTVHAVTTRTASIVVVLCVLTLAAAACATADDPTTTTPVGGSVALTFDFANGSDGWASDLADYTAATRPEDFTSETGVSPPGLGAGSDFFHLAATNTSDDLFMYLRRYVAMDSGLAAGTEYRVAYEIRFASAAPTGCAGIGGAPGESVWMKAGASAIEPVPVDDDGDTRLAVDKGGQSQGGRNAVVAGDVANGIPCEEALEADVQPYTFVTREAALESPVTTGHDGSLWLFVGTDSGFEGRTSIFYDRIDVTLTPVG